MGNDEIPPVPGWRPDPAGRHEVRYWDGAIWTQHVADNGIAGIEPLSLEEHETHRQSRKPTGSVPQVSKSLLLIGASMIALLTVVALVLLSRNSNNGEAPEVPAFAGQNESGKYSLGPGGTEEEFCRELAPGGFSGGDPLDFADERDRWKTLGSLAPPELQPVFVEFLDFVTALGNGEYVYTQMEKQPQQAGSQLEEFVVGTCGLDMGSLEESSTYRDRYTDHVDSIDARTRPVLGRLSDFRNRHGITSSHGGGFGVAVGQMVIDAPGFRDAVPLAIEACEAASEYVYGNGYDQSIIFVLDTRDQELVVQRNGEKGRCQPA